MGILISTNLYNTQQFEKIFEVLEKADNPEIGVEIFPIWHEKEFESILKENIGKLKDRSISFHGPYYNAEHSARKGSIAYARTMDYMKKTLEYAQMLESKYIVYHHNNRKVSFKDKIDMIKASNENLMEINNIAKKYNQKIVVENCGVISNDNMLLNEQEFIELCSFIPNDILIDIGHANCNGWNLEKLIKKLKFKITSYHLHNNFGWIDEHNRIYDGSIDFEKFIKVYKRSTPDAELVMEYSRNLNKDLDGIVQDINQLEELLFAQSIAN